VKIAILTGSELRHSFVRKYLALSPGIDVAVSICEDNGQSLQARILMHAEPGDLRLDHLEERRQSEEDLFGAFVRLAPDRSSPMTIPKGAINDDSVIESIVSAAPALVVAYGPSLIRGPLLSKFATRFLNVHLGLSPYYRGSGTNYWPLVNGQPEYVGATFMHMDEGIDTGQIIHQLRARIYPGDTPHLIGNRLISDMALAYAEIIANFDKLQTMPPLPKVRAEFLYRQMDFTVDSLLELRRRFSSGLVATYLQEREARCAAVPIVENPGVRPLQALMQPWP
jgi:hypothetical protein